MSVIRSTLSVPGRPMGSRTGAFKNLHGDRAASPALPWHRLLASLLALLICSPILRAQEPAPPWPPQLHGAVDGRVTLTTPDFLTLPGDLEQQLAAAPNEVAFTLATTAPTVELSIFPDQALGRRLWSSWGDICVGPDGSVFAGIGDHHDDKADANALVYRWPVEGGPPQLVVDANAAIGAEKGGVHFSKVHASIVAGSDGGIYITPTLNAGTRAPQYTWTQRVPAGPVLRYDPTSNTTKVVGFWPAGQVTPTTLLDRSRNIYYAILEGSEYALAAFDLNAGKLIFEGARGSITHSRNLAMDLDGNVYFNGKGSMLWRYNPDTGEVASTRAALPEGQFMRSSAPPAPDGSIFGSTMGKGGGQLFRFDPKSEEITLLGFDFLTGSYTTVTVLSPGGRYIYYMPGAHGQAVKVGTPVLQFDTRTGQRKVLAFLRDAIESHTGYIPAGSYGVALSSDGSTLYVNFNGNMTDALRPKSIKPGAFGVCAIAAIHIPASEREEQPAESE